MTALAMLTIWTAWVWDRLDGWLVAASVPAWLACLACLSPAVWRLMCRQPRYLDPIWGVVALLAVNRLTFLLHLSSEGSHAMALLLALAMAWLSVSYQRHDRVVPR